MKALKAYILWVGSTVQSGSEPEGAGMGKLDDLIEQQIPIRVSSFTRPNAKAVIRRMDMASPMVREDFTFPPLWGEHSYNQAAGLFSVVAFCELCENGMPLGSSHDTPSLAMRKPGT